MSKVTTSKKSTSKSNGNSTSTTDPSTKEITTMSTTIGNTSNPVPPSPVPPVPPAPAPAPSPAPAPAPSPGPSTIYIAPPPASANIPSPPAGFVPTKGTAYRGVLPRKAELVALPDAVTEIAGFAAWATTLGAITYPQDQTVQALDAAAQWSRMRNESDAWDVYCRVEEGIVWTSVRTMMGRLRPAFDLAVLADPTVATRFPKLASFLGAKQVIAKQSVATKAANKKAVAAGLPPFHGTVGKKRQTKAEKAAAAAAAAAASQQPPPQGGKPAAGPAPAAKVDPAPAGVTPASNGATNGVAHP